VCKLGGKQVVKIDFRDTMEDIIGGSYMQKIAEDFINKYQLHSDESTRYIDLVSEVGELGKEIIKSTNYGKKDFEKNNLVKDEIGDCIFSLLALCYELGIDAQEALNSSLSKYEARFTSKGDIGSN